MTTIDLISKEPYPVRRLGAVVRASSAHPGLLGLFTFRPGQDSIDTEVDEPALVLSERQTLAFEADPSGRLVVSVCEVIDTPPPTGGGEVLSVTKGRVTWRFAERVLAGQFANGDWWVVGPVSITAIEPAQSSMLNPSPRTAERTGAHPQISAPLVYEAAQDVGRSLPLELTGPTSLVSCVPGGTGLSRVLAAEVLTVLPAAPPEGSFRPSWAGPTKTVHSSSGLRRELLRRLAPVAGAPTPQALVPQFSQPWFGDQHPGWIARNSMPPENMPGYGRDISAKIGEAALALHLDYPLEEKEALLVRFVQLGIDLYGIAKDGGQVNWTPNGGHASGRKWPILFAGLMLDDPAMINLASDETVLFGEDAQTWRVTQADVGRQGYTQAHVGLDEWGIRHATEPELDNPSPVANYRTCCTANAWPGIHLAALLTDGARAAWRHEPFFDYLDRYRRDIFPATGLDTWQLDYVPWVGAMWERYRSGIA